MRKKLVRAGLVATGLLIAVAPAKAQTAAPDAPGPAGGDWRQSAAFVADAFPDIHFLDQSSRMAVGHSKNDKIRDFAEQVAKEETAAGNALMRWLRGGQSDITGDPASSSRLAVRLKAPPMLPSHAAFLQRLSSLQGREFDVMYVLVEKDALQRLAAACQDYAQNGGDPGLQEIAARELPAVKQLIATLGDL